MLGPNIEYSDDDAKRIRAAFDAAFSKPHSIGQMLYLIGEGATYARTTQLGCMAWNEREATFYRTVFEDMCARANKLNPGINLHLEEKVDAAGFTGFRLLGSADITEPVFVVMRLMTTKFKAEVKSSDINNHKEVLEIIQSKNLFALMANLLRMHENGDEDLFIPAARIEEMGYNGLPIMTGLQNCLLPDSVEIVSEPESGVRIKAYAAKDFLQKISDIRFAMNINNAPTKQHLVERVRPSYSNQVAGYPDLELLFSVFGQTVEISGGRAPSQIYMLRGTPEKAWKAFELVVPGAAKIDGDHLVIYPKLREQMIKRMTKIYEALINDDVPAAQKIIDDIRTEYERKLDRATTPPPPPPPPPPAPSEEELAARRTRDERNHAEKLEFCEFTAELEPVQQVAKLLEQFTAHPDGKVLGERIGDNIRFREYGKMNAADSVALVLKKLARITNGSTQIDVPRVDAHKHGMKAPVVIDRTLLTSLAETVDLLRMEADEARDLFGDYQKAKREGADNTEELHANAVRKAEEVKAEIAGYGLNADMIAAALSGGQKRG